MQAYRALAGGLGPEESKGKITSDLSPILGSVLAGGLLVALLAGLVIVWRRPFLGLGFLVAGLAFHNFTLMMLLRLGTPALLIRVYQSWKEAIFAVLLLLAFLAVVQAWRASGRPRLLAADWVALGFAFLTFVYLLTPQSWLGGQSDLTERVVAFRAAIYLPLLYFVGRAFAHRATPRDEFWVSWLIVGAGAVVGAFGMVELWLLPTRVWVDWGEPLFNAWLGFNYQGPDKLPANFFQTLVGGSLLLRRMVSTYLSPLGIAYTGLLVVPVAVLLVEGARAGRRRMLVMPAVCLALLLAGILFSVTRLAEAALAVEVVLLAVAMRQRWLVGLSAAVLIAVTLVILVYPLVGPTVDRNLNPARPHYSTSIVSVSDPSAQEHSVFLIGDLYLVIKHPIGVGLGSAVFRYANTTRSGESAVLSVFVDMGVLGGVLYLAMYGLAIFHGYRLIRSSVIDLRAALPLVASVGGVALIPITATSDLWGATAVTFLFWWAAGHVATLAHPSAAPAKGVDEASRQPAS